MIPTALVKAILAWLGWGSIILIICLMILYKLVT